MIQLFKPQMLVHEILSELKPVLESGWIGLGGKTKEFEDKFSEFIGCNHSVAVNSCTAALHLALIIAGVADGDEVLTTSMTFVSTNHVILYQRAIPVFCDIDDVTLGIQFSEIQRKITTKTKAIVVVHYAGYPVDMEPIYEFAKKRNLWVIEDCAHACGAQYNLNNRVGNCNGYEKNIACFSFHPVKNLPTGDGGMITTNNKDVSDRLRRLRWMGIDKDTYVRTETGENEGYNWMYHVGEVGYKYHTNDILATIALVQLKYLEQHNAMRRFISRMYCDRICEMVKTDKFVRVLSRAEGDDGRLSAAHTFPIMVRDRDELVKKFNENNIFPGVHYYPNHMYDIYKPYSDTVLPVTETIWKKLILLPLHVMINREDVFKVVRVMQGGC